MTKTVIEKIASSSSEAAVFKVGGTLGYHENQTLKKFFDECQKRNISGLVLDFSSLHSLGGGCAKIIRESAAGGHATVYIVGASNTVLKFLKSKDKSEKLVFMASIDEALKRIGEGNIASVVKETRSDNMDRSSVGFVSGSEQSEEQENQFQQQETSPEVESSEQEDADHRPVVRGDQKGDNGIPDVIILGLDQEAVAGEAGQPAKEPGKPEEVHAKNDNPDSSNKKISSELRELKKKLVHYNALLTIGSDFNRMDDRVSLVDAFLLTMIAQIGVESAAFYEAKGKEFIRFASKGMGDAHIDFPPIKESQISIDAWQEKKDEFELNLLSNDEKLKGKMAACGFRYALPFVIHEKIRGLVFLGKPIKNELDGDWFDFLRVLMNQAAISYEKTKRIEEESERTLDLVHTLISLIEENTMGRGTTGLVANYTFALAMRMQYPSEFMKDLMFGTVLRDIGMIKVSDLIIRSPRDLLKEEWEIIKRHPVEGAKMLKKMNFSKHTTDIVLYHHERFNGEGYPQGLEGHDIPLGARIVSVVESYAAMLRDKPNRPALEKEEALHTLKENWGLRYDPEVVKSFVAMLEDEERSGKVIEYSRNELFSINGEKT